MAGPLVQVLASLPPAARDEIADRLRVAVAPYTDRTGALDFPGLGLFVTAHRPR